MSRDFDLNVEPPLDPTTGFDSNSEAGHDGLDPNLPAADEDGSTNSDATAVAGSVIRTRRRKDVSEDLGQLVYQTLLARSTNGRLARSVTTEGAAQFGVHLRTVQRLWKRGKTCLAQGVPVDVASRKRGRSGRKPKVGLETRRVRELTAASDGGGRTGRRARAATAASGERARKKIT